MEALRFNLAEVYPEAYKALAAVEALKANSKLTPIQKELIKIRASQINKCAFCINMHTADARKYGETEARIYLLNAWREAQVYTPEERAILAMTEEVTEISKHGLREETYQDVVKHFGIDGTAQILMMIIAINNWNRVAIPLHYLPEVK
ncbi:MAG: carboxymuconolactone decarboxylase family protein [Chitinophaga sp.]|uniref:carboxymuconolactone decarboxylase family protein n=1 Tax=Chitinophaga sp. TaxID=1869181 RepID=UPI0025C59835|nr:carboxymuconolactone decarboxylase family protein [Chitinophaga sp.]MBV8251260.1 carboxymuconolactone decarboxylase family protein [Chitinophaga sp.]